MIPSMPRRSNLSGTKLPDGRYQIRVTLTRLDGAKVRKPVYGKTLGEAQQKAHALIYESGRSLQESYTVRELAEALRVSPRQVETLISERGLKCHQDTPGGTRYISHESLVNYIRYQEEQPVVGRLAGRRAS